MTQVSATAAETKKAMARESAATKTWRHVIQPDADAAANYLNITPAQGPGEATITTRPDGQIDVIFLL
ncbi:hypothetical protein OG871_02005 [Kitasatospora sp. NBC_00374]|uniref:hypothetical protein n=1 Tax=Kitasatospora sp. NBC_00374 TaxID=2975964 RepID=UPI0032486871